MRAHSALKRSERLQEEGWVWYRDIPDRFRCDCGGVDIDLKMIRESLHCLLGRVGTGDKKAVRFSRLYERRALENICSRFADLLQKAPREEDVQKFIQDHTILFHKFSPRRIFFKPSIIGKHKADFGILSSNGELFLVEIEEPGKKLLTKKGERAAPCTHAFEQVLDWLDKFDRHRAACLEGLDLKAEEVVRTRGVVVMGRERDYPSEQLRKLKWTDMHSIVFLTYDDILRDVAGLVETFETLDS